MTSEELMNEIHKKESEIICLTADLTAAVSQIGDWKVAKYQEYILAGLEAPYDIADIHAKRQAARDRINELRAEIEALQATSAELA